MTYIRTPEQRHAEYLRSKEKSLLRAKQWSKNNPEKRKQILIRWNKKAVSYKRNWRQQKFFNNIVGLDNCILCDADEKLVVHHRDGNNGKMGHSLNNDKSNLVVLCRSCHAKAHSHGKIRILV